MKLCSFERLTKFANISHFLVTIVNLEAMVEKLNAFLLSYLKIFLAPQSFRGEIFGLKGALLSAKYDDDRLHF